MEPDPVESTESPVESPSEVVTPRQKAPRTPAQLAALDAARQKAMKIRTEKAELSRKEKEVARVQLERQRSERAAKIQSEYDALHAVESPAPPPPEAEPLPPKKARKPARRIIVHEVSSAEEDEDDTVDVILPKAKPVDPYARVRQKMFGGYE
jgi:sRNA-binding protein